MTKAERIAVFFGRLAAAEPAASAAAARVLVTEILTAVEDELAGADDRMLPPSDEYSADIEGRADLLAFRQRAHDTIIGANGAILIRIRKTGAVSFEKAGLDGRKVEL